ncbi:MAG: cytochrome-c peroxidase, partial [Gloeobacteraceae cyanobacterium ES-bin-316]|nr:cytochrome-c peroxidase [Ferruginibacter sp.]
MKFRVIISLFLFAASSLFIIGAGRGDGYGPFKPQYLSFLIPKGWPKPATNYFEKNRLTEQGFQLGKKLFYDSRLSKDREVSCAGCHQPFGAFATFDHDLSHGVNNSFTTRNAPALMNLAWMQNFHWDGAINHLEVQPLGPLTAANEMGQTLDSILFFLKSDTAYRRMFKAAFGDPSISSQRMLWALAQFTGSLVTANSKYDRVMNGQDTFSNFEKNGYRHFKNNCAGCHKEPLFTDNSFRNNGISLNRFKDAGRQLVTGLSSDSLKFKVPSLRNIQLTYPYMHDGSIFSVPQVLDHYISKINIHQPG